MQDLTKFYINNNWVNPINKREHKIINPANEKQIATISLGSEADVNIAVKVAVKAFASYSNTSIKDKLELLHNLLKIYNKNQNKMAHAISQEMGAPIEFAKKNQVTCGNGHIQTAIETLKSYKFNKTFKTGNVIREPIGVCGMITPWNWPINQITCKVIPALAAGCSVILKPSEFAPLSSHLFATMIHSSGYTAGVFNLINGLGKEVGAKIAEHPDIAMVSFTGSNAAGIAVSKSAANNIKRVSLELGGKSPNIILEHPNFKKAVVAGVAACFSNSGQSCNAPTRMLVPDNKYTEAIKIAKKYAANIKVGNPADTTTIIGPLVSKTHFNRVQQYIDIGIKEGAKLICGGTGKPYNLKRGFYVKPTIFADVSEDMIIVKEEIFGPVLCIQKFKNSEQAIAMANNTKFGLAAYISGERTAALTIANKLQAGMIHINGKSQGFDCPFGGYKQSGNGREWGKFGFEEYLETKVIAAK